MIATCQTVFGDQGDNVFALLGMLGGALCIYIGFHMGRRTK